MYTYILHVNFYIKTLYTYLFFGCIALLFTHKEYAKDYHNVVELVSDGYRNVLI